jgi:hypothetical protein
MGRFLIIAGFLVVLIGLLIHFKIQVPWLTGWIGKLPGDLIVRKKGMTLYLPLGTSLLISLILSFIFSIFRK